MLHVDLDITVILDKGFRVESTVVFDTFLITSPLSAGSVNTGVPCT